MERQKKCTKETCGFVCVGEAEIKAGFYKGTNICIFCRDEMDTHHDPWREKVRKTRADHAKKLGISIKDLEDKHGWKLDVMLRDAQSAHKGECPECHQPYAGLEEISIDIWDPRIEPDYDSNTRWICMGCNSSKGQKTPEEWAMYKRLRREREIWIAAQMELPKWKQQSLFGEDD